MLGAIVNPIYNVNERPLNKNCCKRDPSAVNETFNKQH